MVNKILRAGNNHEKEYMVTVNKPVTDEFILNMGRGVPILGEMTKKCKVIKDSMYSFRIVLVQGLNRQIRRMCEHFDYEVVKLERIRIMNISVKGIPVGEWRQLQPNEMKQIMDAVSTSSSTHEASAPKKTKEPGIKNQEPRAKIKDIASQSIERRTQNAERGTRSPDPGTKSTKRKTGNANPKSRELRERSSNSNGKKAGSFKNIKPSSKSFGKGKR